jgi:signal transduction histidine kinase
MHPAVLAASMVLVTASLMAGYVALRREKHELHWLLVAVLLALMVWTSGTIARFSVTTEAGLAVALRVVFLGVFATPPLWLLLAARYAQYPVWLERRPTWVAVLAPSALTYLALLTNEAHLLVVRETTFEAMRAGGMAWAGPVFLCFVAWAHVCVLAGAWLYLRTARRLVAGPPGAAAAGPGGRAALVLEERRRGLLLALAALVPLLASSIYLFRLLPVSFDVTPAALTITLGILCLVVFRYQLLESLPLARQDVIEHLHDGVVMASLGGSILDLNPAAAAILGAPVGGLRRRPLHAALAALCAGEGGEPLLSALEGLGPGSAPLRVEVRTSDDRIVEVSVAWVLDARGEPTGRYALLRDRSEERRFERLVRHAQKLRTVGTLASGIAHEVNNPLAFIRANLSELRRMGERVEACAGEDPEKLAAECKDLRAIAEESLDGIERIERIVSGMRRLASPREEPLRPVDVAELVRDALRLSNLSSDPHVSVHARFAEGVPPVEAAPERLVQALLNLLVNARQALAGRSGNVWLETGSRDGWVEVHVRDDGPGVPEALRERVFDPFFTTRDPDQGMGLGLAIAFDILRDHAGTLEVRSAPGGGAWFVARLPASR